MAMKQCQSLEVVDENSKSGGEEMEFTTDDECTGQRARRQVKGKLQDVDINLQRIISKTKSESMFELRKLTHHQHPVSAFDSKQTLEEFLSSRQPPPPKSAAVGPPQHDHSHPSAPAEAATLPCAAQETVSDRIQQYVPSLEPNPQNLMPDEVRLEMQNLMERQIVHEVLQGPVHEEIDRTLREGMEQRQARRRPRPRPRPRLHVPQAEDGDEGGDEMGRGPARPVGRLLSSSRSTGRRGRASGSSHNRHVRFVPQIPTPNAEGRYPLPRRNQGAIVDQLRQSPALNHLEDETRDEIVAEVSSLVSQQLVTSALSGEFRGVLELHIQSRAQQIDRGLRPTVPPAHHQEQEYLDDFREALPSAHFQELREEIMGMKGQLCELKQMVKLSFDLQLDIQRAIRQEVAAALAIALSQQNLAEGGEAQVHTCPLPTLTPSGQRSINVVDSGRCVICSEGVIDSVIYHCGHMCTCTACGLELKSKALKCPICRAPITDIIRAYTSML